MKIIFISSENSQFSKFLNFIKESSFYVNELQNNQSLKESRLVVCEKNINLKELQNFLIKLDDGNPVLTMILMPKNFKAEKLRFKKILYPLSINNFEKIIRNEINSANILFKDISLSADNMVTNLKNNKSIFLTETEKEIFKLLIGEKKVKKETLKYEILNFQLDINTKSLESHLSRLRKKLNQINSLLTISPLDNSIQIL